MDSHSFFADPNPDVLLNADPDQAAFLKCGYGYSLNKFVKNYLMESFLELKNTNKNAQTYTNHGAGTNLLYQL